MFTGYKTAEDLTRCLTDAGCGEEMIACLSSCLSNGNKQECLCRLEEWREELLGEIRKERSGMEYLDGLLAEIKKNDLTPSQKLKEIGSPDALIFQYQRYLDSDDKRGQERLLYRFRGSQSERLQKDREKLFCLDYIISMVENL